MDWTIPIIVIQLIFLEGILSLDNAAVLGAMVSDLPDDIAVPWPPALQRTGAGLQHFVGNQRTAALRVGLLGAYIGRGLMLFLATVIIQNPWLKLVGAAYLVYLAFDNLGIEEVGEESSGAVDKIHAKSFWMVVLTVEMTDLICSLDNVVAAVTLSDRFWVVMLGVAIGILMMRFAAGWFSYAVLREPILRSAAYILILIIGIELILSELGRIEINDWLRMGISVGTILLCLLYAHSPFLQQLRPILHTMGRGFSRFNVLVARLLAPVGWVLRRIRHGLQSLHPHTPKQQGS